MNTELDDIGVQVETLRAAEQAAAKHAERESAVKRPPFPGKSTERTDATVKSLGELVIADARYENSAQGGRGGGIDLRFPALCLSEALGKSQERRVGKDGVRTGRPR